IGHWRSVTVNVAVADPSGVVTATVRTPSGAVEAIDNERTILRGVTSVTSILVMPSRGVMLTWRPSADRSKHSDADTLMLGDVPGRTIGSDSEIVGGGSGVTVNGADAMTSPLLSSSLRLPPRAQRARSKVIVMPPGASLLVLMLETPRKGSICAWSTSDRLKSPEEVTAKLGEVPCATGAGVMRMTGTWPTPAGDRKPISPCVTEPLARKPAAGKPAIVSVQRSLASGAIPS